LLHRCYLGVLGLSFSTYSRILFSSEYFHPKIFIHEKYIENENDRFQENFSRPGIIDTRARYRAAARRLRNIALQHLFFLAYVEIYVFRGNPFQAHGLEQSYHPTQPIKQEKFNTKSKI